MNISSSLCQIKGIKKEKREYTNPERKCEEVMQSTVSKCLMTGEQVVKAGIIACRVDDSLGMSEMSKTTVVGGRKTRADSLWFSRKKGVRESSSGSREERGGAKVCPAPVRRGVNVEK